MTAHALVCRACDHYSSRHRLSPDAAIDGPYVCIDCGCEAARHTPSRGLTKRQYEAREAASAGRRS